MFLCPIHAWMAVYAAAGFVIWVLVLVTDGYGPLIELSIWPLSANSHFSSQSLAQSLLASPSFIRHARCLSARRSNEHSLHGFLPFWRLPSGFPTADGVFLPAVSLLAKLARFSSGRHPLPPL